jgi:hypothetical protein
MLRSLTAAVALASFFGVAPAVFAEVTLEKSPGGVRVSIDGKPFTEYLVHADLKPTHKPASKPILWPLVGPGDKRVTRNWPMEEGVPGETDHDHIHQQSLWFTHGSVNGIDFWSEGKGIIEHREFVKVESGPQATLVTRNDWLSPDGSKLQLQDERTLIFGGDAQRRWIDFSIVLNASNGPVVFGDTKEGSFGARMASSMRVAAKPAGRIINSDGLTDDKAWGKPAAWVDYHGPVDGDTVGIAILNHPDSFRFPTYWHVRTYGLFAANPFGLHDFTAGAKTGEYTLPAGESLRLRYRVLLHQGDEKAGRVAESFADFAK